MDIKVSISARGAIFDGKSETIMLDAITAAMYEATSFIEREVKKRTPVGVSGARGGLIASIHGEVQRGTRYVKGIVGHQSTYGDVVELGRRPGKTWPPEGSLIKWIQVKLGVDAVKAKKLEFVIRRKIGQKGIPGVFMFRNALDENWPKLEAMFQKYGFIITRAFNAE